MGGETVDRRELVKRLETGQMEGTGQTAEKTGQMGGGGRDRLKRVDEDCARPHPRIGIEARFQGRPACCKHITITIIMIIIIIIIAIYLL